MVLQVADMLLFTELHTSAIQALVKDATSKRSLQSLKGSLEKISPHDFCKRTKQLINHKKLEKLIVWWRMMKMFHEWSSVLEKTCVHSVKPPPIFKNDFQELQCLNTVAFSLTVVKCNVIALCPHCELHDSQFNVSLLSLTELT